MLVTMKLYELTDVEVAGLLRKQLKGQARGLLKQIKDEDFEKPDILENILNIFNEAYTN